jgi:hypothetical protein
MDNAKYYIKSEDVQTGLLSSFVVEENGKLVNRVMTANEAIMNNNAAWQIQFNPINSYYTIRNVATGKYFTYTASGNNGISTIQKTTPSSAEQFQLMMGRVNVNLESLTTRGYWIIHPEHKSAPNCLVANIGETTLASGFNIANTSTKQRWLILSSKDLEDFGLVLFLDKNETKTAADSEHHIYVKNSEVHIESYATESDVMIYNSQGEVIAEANNINTAYSQRLPIGLYIVAVSSASGKIVRKVEVW